MVRKIMLSFLFTIVVVGGFSQIDSEASVAYHQDHNNEVVENGSFQSYLTNLSHYFHYDGCSFDVYDIFKDQTFDERVDEQNTEEKVTNQGEISENEHEVNNDESIDGLNEFELQVFNLTNEEREKQGLQPLAIDEELSQVAREKSRDMAQNGYFDHQSPTYGSPFDMMRTYGINYQTAGENIAKGQRTPEEVVNAWMNSEGHRANILNPSFTHIGIGYVEQGNHWTQQFIGR